MAQAVRSGRGDLLQF